MLAAVKAATRGAETVATARFRSVLVFLDPFTFGGKPEPGGKDAFYRAAWDAGCRPSNVNPEHR